MAGRVKFARRYGLSVDEAAPVNIARRAMIYSEKLPRSSTGTVKVPANGSDLDLPARKDALEHAPKSRHVWSEWNGPNKDYRKALAALGPSRLTPRPKRGSSQTTGRSILPGGSGRNLASGAEREPFDGLTEYARCFRRKSLQSRRHGCAASWEPIPEPKFGTWLENSFQPFVTNTRTTQWPLERRSPIAGGQWRMF